VERDGEDQFDRVKNEEVLQRVKQEKKYPTKNKKNEG